MVLIATRHVAMLWSRQHRVAVDHERPLPNAIASANHICLTLSNGISDNFIGEVHNMFINFIPKSQCLATGKSFFW